MRSLWLAAIIVLVGLTCASAQAQTYRVGMARIAVQDTEPFEAIVWYPVTRGSAAGPNAEIADGARFPVVLLSHGRKGSPFGHRELAARLAQDGLIVVAPTHVGDSSSPSRPRSQLQILIDRPRQVHKALDAFLADARFTSHADPSRMGMIGYSAGGYTTLVLAGTKPNFEHALTYCRDHADDRGSCGVPRTNGGHRQEAVLSGDDAYWQAMREPRLKAIVLMDPLAILFDRAALQSVRLSALLIRPQHDDYLRAAGNAQAVVEGLGRPPQQLLVPGSHFVLLDPCPSALAAQLAILCVDAPGVDRVAIHRQIEAAISDFLRKSL